MSIPQYFAQIDENNVCVNIAVVTRLFMEENPDRYEGTWVECFLDAPNKTYPGTGFIYDAATNDFVEPTPPNPINETPVKP